jgi:hypothetical protein
MKACLQECDEAARAQRRAEHDAIVDCDQLVLVQAAHARHLQAAKGDAASGVTHPSAAVKLVTSCTAPDVCHCVQQQQQQAQQVSDAVCAVVEPQLLAQTAVSVSESGGAAADGAGGQQIGADSKSGSSGKKRWRELDSADAAASAAAATAAVAVDTGAAAASAAAAVADTDTAFGYDPDQFMKGVCIYMVNRGQRINSKMVEVSYAI